MYLVKCSHWLVLVRGVLWERYRLKCGWWCDDVKWGRMMMRNSMRARSAGLESGGGREVGWGGASLDELKMKRRAKEDVGGPLNVLRSTVPPDKSFEFQEGWVQPLYEVISTLSLNWISIILHLIHYLSKCNYEISFQNSTPLPKLLDQKIHSPKKMLEMLTTKKMQTFEVQLRLLHCALQAWCQSRTLPIKWQ